MTDRLAELEASLAALRAKIATACAAADRDPAEITLVAVTKTFPVSDIKLLSQLGVTDIGENRDSEAAPKAAACAAAGLTVRWHFVGQLQVNKVPSVAGYADMVHSVDRLRLAEALGRRSLAAGRVISCLIQVSLDDPGQSAGRGGAGRGGAGPAEVGDLAAAIAAHDGLRLAGVMGIAPLGEPARPAYAQLRQIAETIRAAYPSAQVISAGMSGDMGSAIAEGATHVRIGTALLGGRPPFLR
ncbi:MAG TPA: YggS family pyridoxal phosphate-dependent enzyme [Streptosporangiaceae bacterium]|nr:YggS family pyridoxal phosphate-dependent enzyme [Streptosporangiaceae bacterium]